MDRCIQIDSVSHRDEEELASLARPENGAQHVLILIKKMGDEERLASLARPEICTQHVLVLMEKVGAGAFFLSRFPVFTDQPGFGAANGETIQKQSHMTGETKFPWMSQPLIVEKN